MPTEQPDPNDPGPESESESGPTPDDSTQERRGAPNDSPAPTAPTLAARGYPIESKTSSLTYNKSGSCQFSLSTTLSIADRLDDLEDAYIKLTPLLTSTDTESQANGQGQGQKESQEETVGNTSENVDVFGFRGRTGTADTLNTERKNVIKIVESGGRHHITLPTRVCLASGLSELAKPGRASITTTALDTTATKQPTATTSPQHDADDAKADVEFTPDPAIKLPTLSRPSPADEDADAPIHRQLTSVSNPDTPRGIARYQLRLPGAFIDRYDLDDHETVTIRFGLTPTADSDDPTSEESQPKPTIGLRLSLEDETDTAATADQGDGVDVSMRLAKPEPNKATTTLPTLDIPKPLVEFLHWDGAELTVTPHERHIDLHPHHR